jgi:hypothetical protein
MKTITINQLDSRACLDVTTALPAMNSSERQVAKRRTRGRPTVESGDMAGVEEW